MGILNHHFAAGALSAQSDSLPLTAANLCNRADAGKLGHLVHATNSFTALALPSAGCGPGAERANCARAAACAILRTSPREPAPAVASTGAASAQASRRGERSRPGRGGLPEGRATTPEK